MSGLGKQSLFRQLKEKDREIERLKSINELLNAHNESLILENLRLKVIESHVKKMEFMIDKGLGWEDMKNDVKIVEEL